MTRLRWVVFDIGEVLVDETRVWSVWADVVGVSRFELLAAIGAMIAAGRPHTDAFAAVGIPDWPRHADAALDAYGAFRAEDLYADAVPTLRALAGAGLGVAVAGNQPAQRTRELRALGVPGEPLFTSDEIGVEKPDAAFFRVLLARLGNPDPAAVAYVGDRVDNDVEPARAAGLVPVWLRRGPWGLLAPPPAEPVLTVRTLAELPGLLP